MVGLWYAYVFSDVSGAMGRRHAPSRQSRPHIRTHKTKRTRGLPGGDPKDEEQASHDDEINDLTHEHTKGKQKEANRKERANKTARVKWGRAKREANVK